MAKGVKVWDGFIRFFHWATVLLLAALWWTAEQGQMDRHQDLAMVLLALIITRIGWGIVGSDSSRFSRFVRSPIAAIKHLASLKQRPFHYEPTHNAAGAWFVMLILALLLVQLISGLFATDEILFSGPLSGMVSGALASDLTSWHKLNFNIILAVVGLHVVAIIIYRLLGARLAEGMIHGRLPIAAESAPQLRSGWWPFISAAALAAALLYWVN
ncbi:cytochrome b/b6 domain-containing protein [Idiomarina xiamenensis]|uniref:Cytochrome b n=1 Tax=Idiomarina xiamenensis 10-D-4 TaxID=740709 RepID=K2KPE9_9GAMM|nr:cytochrome b/b6 domain-containing protein [Idiomarina xiamenensis]EKE84279.1 cytochrome b [Idiomarina xiamenensis 10-D-4]